MDIPAHTRNMISFRSLFNRHLRFSIYVFISLMIFIETGAQDTCLGHVVKDTGTCYTYYDDLVTWSEAVQRCRSRDGYLAAFVDPREQDVLRYLFPGSLTPAGTASAWIGAYHTKGQWRWVESNAVLGPQGCYSDRRETHLRDMETVLGTVDNLTPSLCIAACRRIMSPKSYQYASVQGGNQCYCGNSTYGRYGTDSKCTTKCSDTTLLCGGMLMNSVYKIDGAYGIWAYAQPNNYKGNQYCGIVDTSHQSKMADESCFEPRAYMCEISTNSCPRGQSSGPYYYHAPTDRCFYLNETKVTWYEAKQACSSLRNPGPGHLVTIESAQTYEIIKYITIDVLPVAQKIWIGLYKGAGWRWSTGANFNFTDWAPTGQQAGNPTSVGTCGTVNVTLANKWTDTSCTDQLPYICQTGGTSVPEEVPTFAPEVTLDDVGTDVGTQSLVTPSAGASTGGDSGLSTLELVLAVVMSLLGLLLLILMIYCLVVMCQKRNNKIFYWYDARPAAPVPDSGITGVKDYDKYRDNRNSTCDSSSNSCIDSTTELYRPGPW